MYARFIQDEASMLSAELLEVLIYHLKQIREEYNKEAAVKGYRQVSSMLVFWAPLVGPTQALCKQECPSFLLPRCHHYRSSSLLVSAGDKQMLPTAVGSISSVGSVM